MSINIEDFDIDAIDATFMGLGSYLNEKESISLETLENTLPVEEFKNMYSVQPIPYETKLRPFEQHVQNSINKLKNNKI